MVSIDSYTANTLTKKRPLPPVATSTRQQANTDKRPRNEPVIPRNRSDTTRPGFHSLPPKPPPHLFIPKSHTVHGC